MRNTNKLMKFMLVLTIMCFCMMMLASCEQEDVFDYDKHIEKHLKILEKDPDNCFSNEQIAASYQALYDYDEAIRYYEVAVKNCPDDYSTIFQFGVSYYLNKEKEKGLELMEKAIQVAIKANDIEWAEAFRHEKDTWINNWEHIEKLDLEGLRKPRNNK